MVTYLFDFWCLKDNSWDPKFSFFICEMEKKNQKHMAECSCCKAQEQDEAWILAVVNAKQLRIWGQLSQPLWTSVSFFEKYGLDPPYRGFLRMRNICKDIASLILYPEINHQINNLTGNSPQLFILLLNSIFTLRGSFSFLVVHLCEWGEVVILIII